MLRPRAVQATLQALLEAPDVPADTALVVFSDSGMIYSQAHSRDPSQVASSSTLPKEPSKRPTDSQRLQYARQPGLFSLLGRQKSPSNTIDSGGQGAEEDGAASLPPSGAAAMEVALQTDERAKILAALACQSWQEEINRVRRLFSKIHGHQAAVAMSETSDRLRSFSASTSGGAGGSGTGSGKNGALKRRVEQNGLHRSTATLYTGGGEDHLERRNTTIEQQGEEQQESVAAPVAVPGTLLNVGTSAQSIAPLLLEGELGALLIMPLHHQAINPTPPSPALPNSPALLLVLSKGAHSMGHQMTRAGAGNGTSLLSQQQWNDLHDAASAFAAHVGAPLRKAFGRDERDEVDAATMSDVESSVDFEGLAVGGVHDGPGGILVR